MATADQAFDGLGLEEALGLLRAVPYAVAVLDAEGRVTYANDACAHLLAWSGGGDLRRPLVARGVRPRGGGPP